MDEVHLTGPDVRAEGDGYRASAELRVGDDRVQTWLRSSAPAVSTLLDPFLAAIVPAAMKLGRPLHLHGRVSSGFLAQYPLIQRVFQLYRIDPYHADKHRFRPFEIVLDDADVVATSHAGTQRASMFSAGVDSFYTAITRRDELDALLFIDGFDAPMSDAQDTVHANAAGAAAELGMVLHRTATNLTAVLARGIGPSGPEVSWKMLGGSILQAVALLHAPVARLVVHPSSDAPGSYDTFGTTPWLGPLYSAAGQVIEHDDYFVTRFEKTQRIVEEPVTWRHLRVCWRAGMNCGRCPKCVRTLVALEALGVRERVTTFPALSGAELGRMIEVAGREDQALRTVYLPEVDDYLEDTGTRPDLRAAIAEAAVLTPEPIEPIAALAALTPMRVRRAVRRLRA